MTVLAKRFFFHSYFVQYVAAKDTSQLKMLYGYPEGEYCQYSSQRSKTKKKKTKNKKKNKKQKTKNRDLMNLLE